MIFATSRFPFLHGAGGPTRAFVRAQRSALSDGLIHRLRRRDRAHLSTYFIGVATHAFHRNGRVTMAMDMKWNMRQVRSTIVRATPV